jgi:hypothetical protein
LREQKLKTAPNKVLMLMKLNRKRIKFNNKKLLIKDFANLSRKFWEIK